jgi:hypothetical protein
VHELSVAPRSAGASAAYRARMHAPATVDTRFLAHLSKHLLCSRCLQHGVRTKIVQVISSRHRPRSLCSKCRSRR